MAKLIFDAQVFQTPAWHRGMGKYSFELIRAIAKQNQVSNAWDTIDVIVSSSVKLDKGLEADLKSLPRVKIKQLDLVSNDILNPQSSSLYNRRAIDESIGNAQDDITFIILSLMQGEVSPTFPTRSDIHKAVLFYDLIPLMFHKTYLQNPITRKEYLSKLEELLQADTYLAISKTVANDLSVYLGIEPSRIVSIDGGPIAHDARVESIEIPQHFILMPTGNDLRKNNRRGIEGFDLFNKKHGDKYSLVVTSYFEDWQIDELSKLSKKIIFTGNISGAKLNYLYSKAEALLFPSLYEGLGLPVLEALENNIPVACSDITVFREISQTAFAFFEPYKIHSIAKGIEKSINMPKDKRATNKILQKYSWDNTAKITMESVSQRLVHSQMSGKLSIVTPDLSGDSMVGKMILQSHASFSKCFDVMYYECKNDSNAERRINFLPYISTLHALDASHPIHINSESRTPVYHVTNQKDSVLILMTALAVPGVLVLHDINLKTVWNEMKNQGMISDERHQLESQIQDSFGGRGSNFIGSLVAIQSLVVVFSRESEKLLNTMVKKMGVATKVEFIDLPVNHLVYTDIIAAKRGKVVRFSDVYGVGDMEYEVMLSKAGRFVSSPRTVSTEDLLPVFEAEKYHSDNESSYEHYARRFSDLIKSVEKSTT